MPEERELYKVELINLVEIAKLPRLSIMHRMKVPAIKAAKVGGPKAIEILKGKPGGAEVIAKLRKRGKLTPNPLSTIGFSAPTDGDPWSAINAEIRGPGVDSVLFCCSYGLNGVWQSSFDMPATDDLLALVHVWGFGKASTRLDGNLLGSQPFSGDDWIVVPVSNVAAGRHTFEIAQDSGYFSWLSTEYIRL